MSASDAADTRPADLVPLHDGQRARVRAQLAREEVTCGACGGTAFAVGDALYVGFLFRSERADSWMVALTCTTPGCPSPRAAVRVHDPRGLLGDGQAVSSGQGSPRRSSNGTSPRSSAASSS
ncbi:hypothetical protein [Actinomycetospora chibensis]|uniref:Uncharacterized protein n=1 Tax=Actinomycetospora chibensis TaxID=663606 RepID=A0ABV9RQR2_9PSEU|nr:hypothetical protein [Actinomycetospora chibensis]MDD7923247.1 hypothetical protein [Actinomycetospora chibensis]